MDRRMCVIDIFSIRCRKIFNFEQLGFVNLLEIKKKLELLSKKYGKFLLSFFRSTIVNCFNKENDYHFWCYFQCILCQHFCLRNMLILTYFTEGFTLWNAENSPPKLGYTHILRVDTVDDLSQVVVHTIHI